MTEEEIISIGSKLLLLAGMIMEDVAPQLIMSISTSTDLNIRTSELCAAAEQISQLGMTAATLSKMAKKSPGV